MFVIESVRPQFGHAFSLGLHTLARPFSGLTFLLTPPSASFALQALTSIAVFVFELFLTALPAHPHLIGHRIPSRGSLLYSRFGSFQLSVYPLSVDAQASHVLADLSKYITLECLGVLHLSILRYNPLLLHQITSASLSQPKVFFAFLNHVSPSPLRSSLSQSYSLTWYAVVSWRSCTVFKIFLQGHAYEIFDTGLVY